MRMPNHCYTFIEGGIGIYTLFDFVLFVTVMRHRVVLNAQWICKILQGKPDKLALFLKTF